MVRYQSLGNEKLTNRIQNPRHRVCLLQLPSDGEDAYTCQSPRLSKEMELFHSHTPEGYFPINCGDRVGLK